MVGTAPAQLEPGPNPFRFDRAELAGAVGDLGVLVPIAVALIVKNGLTPTAVLLPAGLLYVVAGLIYRLPVPVQPLKAFGAIAIAHGFGADDIAAGALLMGLLFLVLGASGLLDWVAKVFPHPIIRGIQLSVGLLFCQLAWRLVSNTPKAFTDHRHSVWWLAGATVRGDRRCAVVATPPDHPGLPRDCRGGDDPGIPRLIHRRTVGGARPAPEPGRVRRSRRRPGAPAGAVVVRQLVSGHRGHRPYLFRRCGAAGTAGTVGNHDRCWPICSPVRSAACRCATAPAA